MSTNRERLASLLIPHSAVAGVAGVSPQEFSLYLRDPNLLTEPKRSVTQKAIDDCCWIAEAARDEFPPALCINWRNFAAVRELIDWFRSQVSAQVFISDLREAQKENSVVI